MKKIDKLKTPKDLMIFNKPVEDQLITHNS